MSDLLSSLFRALSPLWEMSLTAAYAAAIVALLRLVLKKRAPRQVLCLLWLVVFARLLIPVSLESPMSIVPDAQQVQLAQELPSKLTGGEQAAPAQDHGPAQDPAQGQTPGGVTADPVSQGNTGAANDPILSVPSGAVPDVPQGSAQAGFPWQALVAGVWLAGVLAMGGYGLISYFHLRRRLYDAIRAQDGAWEHPAVGSPFILGVLRPRIYLPAGLHGQPRQFILCHERAHLRRLDHVVKPICWLALALHWFNPLVWMAFLLMSRDIEAACDEAVIRQLGPRVKADYSATLLSLATNGRVPAPCPLAFDEGNAKGRIKNVLNYRRPALWIVVVSVVMAVLAAVCLLTDPVSAEAPDGPDPDPDASVSQDPAPSQPPEEDPIADPWMIEVLDGEREFFVRGAGSLTIDRLAEAFYGDEPGRAVAVSKLAVIDLDKDGVKEMVLWPSINGDDSIETVSVPGYLILRWGEDGIFGFDPGFRSFAYLKEDGTFYWSSSAFEGGIATARFPDDIYFDLENVSWCDISVEREDYFVDGVRADYDAYQAAIYAQDHKPEVPWWVYEGGQFWPAPLEAPFRPDSLTSDPGPRDLTQEELEYFQAYFAIGNDGLVPNIRSMLLVSEYNDPQDIDLFRTFYHGFHHGITQEERDALGWNGYFNEVKVTAAEMDQTLRAYLGLGLEETNKVGLDTFNYLSAYNAYYTAHTDFGGDWFTMRSGRVRADGTIALVYDSSEFKTTRVALLEEAEQIYAHRLYYRVKANLPADAQDPYAALPQPISVPTPSAEPEPSQSLSAAPAVCEHGLESMGLEFSGSQLVARCTQDDHTYPVPGVTSAEWNGQTGTADGSGWMREDMDGDGQMEVFVFVTDSDFIVDSRIVSLDVENGALVTHVYRFQSLIDDFNQNSDYELDFENQIMTVSYQGRTKQAEIDEGYWSYMLNHGGGYAPEIWPTDMWITNFLICGFPVHNGRGLDLGINAMWSFDYSASGGLRPMFASNW